MDDGGGLRWARILSRKGVGEDLASEGNRTGTIQGIESGTCHML